MSDVKSVRELVRHAADSYGEKIFCRYYIGDQLQEKSFTEFYENCLAVARYIRSVSEKRMHIAFIGKTGYEYIACLTGMIFSGNVVVPFAPDITVEEAVKLFDDADIEMLFCEDDFLPRAKEISEKYTRLQQVISLGDLKWFGDIFKKYDKNSEYAPLSEVEVDPDACALIVYTSGTTGDRKGVMLSNRNMAANTCYNEYNMDTEDVSFSVLPMHHVFCYCCDVLKTIYDGGTLCLNGDMKNLYKNFLRFEPTIMRIVPSLCKSILTRIKITQKNNPDLSKREAAEKVVGKNFRRMIAGSAFLSGKLIDEFEQYGITARQGYGMSECSPRITTSDFSDNCKYSNGKILSVNEVRSEDGEIQVKGPSVMIGYYKRPEQTKAAFTDDGFLHTGDLGFVKDGHIYLVGRKKNLIILSNGENVSPEEIENLFADESIVKEVVVYGENDVIVCEVFPDRELYSDKSEDELKAMIDEIVSKINENSPQIRRIAQVKLRDKPFARTPSGKIKRTEFYFDKGENK
ncbi:MAG: AMP-binding protein [Acutalibacteraceae bacterium]